jgi:hypothetical protein
MNDFRNFSLCMNINLLFFIIAIIILNYYYTLNHAKSWNAFHLSDRLDLLLAVFHPSLGHFH